MTNHLGLELITINYYAIPNGRDGHGFLPIVRSTVGDTGNTWQTRGYDRDVALEIAERMAQEMADRFCGDYLITVEAGTDPAPRVTRV